MKKDKRFWILSGVVCVALFLFGRSCGINSVVKASKIDTFVRVQVEQYPFIVLDTVPVEIPGKIRYVKTTDSFWIPGDVIEKPVFVSLPDSTEEWVIDILNDYQTERIYDTDTMYSGFRIFDTVSRNRITGRRLVINKFDTTIKKLETIFPPKKLVGYFSFSVNKYEVGAGIGMKLKNDWMINVELKSKHMNPELRILAPIKLKK